MQAANGNLGSESMPLFVVLDKDLSGKRPVSQGPGRARKLCPEVPRPAQPLILHIKGLKKNQMRGGGKKKRVLCVFNNGCEKKTEPSRPNRGDYVLPIGPKRVENQFFWPKGVQGRLEVFEVRGSGGEHHTCSTDFIPWGKQKGGRVRKGAMGN